MRPFLVALLLAVVAFAGCAETADLAPAPVQDTDEPVVEEVNETTVIEMFEVSVVAENATAGTPFNVTIDSFLPADAASNATWIVANNGTDLANGTGLPATVALNLTEGNHTIDVHVMANGYEDAFSSLNITVALGEEPFAEPMEHIFEGSVSGLLPNAGLRSCDTGDQTFDVAVDGRYHALRFTMDADDGLQGADLDWTIRGPGGESHSSDAIGNESPKQFDLPSKGAWTVTVHCYTSFGDNDFTVTAALS